MKQFCILFLLTLMSASCSKSKICDEVIIRGNINYNGHEKIVIWVKDNPLKNATDYVSNIDKCGTFNFTIPIERLSTAQIKINNNSFKLILLPDDNFTLEIYEEEIIFEGKGADRNNFLFAIKEKQLIEKSFTQKNDNKSLSLDDYLLQAKEFKNKRLAILDDFERKGKLEDEFIEFFKIENEVLYETLLRDYFKNHVRKSKIDQNSLSIPSIYAELITIDGFTDDNKIKSYRYIKEIKNLIYPYAKIIKKGDTTLSWDEAKHIFMIDSLNGQTKEYILAGWIDRQLSLNTYDTIAIEEFERIKKNKIPTKTIENAFKKRAFKMSLIGKTLPPEFENTVLLDTSKCQISFKELIQQHKGKVVYLDIWAMSCYPCRLAMPYSKKLHESLEENTVSFIYLSVDKVNTKNWDKVFKTTLTEENHYVLKNGFDAQLMTLMDIYWIPYYEAV